MPATPHEHIDKMEKEAVDISSVRTPSYSWASILFFYFIIFITVPYIGEITGLVLFVSLITVSCWSALSLKQYTKLKESYPSETRSTYILNMLLFPVIVPLIIFIILLFLKLS